MAIVKGECVYMMKMILLCASFIEDVIVLLKVMEITNYNTIAILGIIFGSLIKNIAICAALLKKTEL